MSKLNTLEDAFEKFKDLVAHAFQEYDELHLQQKSFMDHVVEVLNSQKESMEKLINNNNQILPQISQLHSDHAELATAYQNLVDLLEEAEIIQKALPTFKRVH